MKINRNTIWSDLFVTTLERYGVRNVCISPGSRSTPLTIAFAKNKKIKKYVLIDERQAGFFALGIAKSTNTPVALVSTSGTAVGEYFPAVIEAYYQRTPLIICTADRPPELHNCGANQTINQENIFRNNIIWDADLGIPSICMSSLKKLIATAKNAVDKAIINSRGPVHLNFPFQKPFEPKAYTDEIDDNLYREIFRVAKTKTKFKITKRSVPDTLITKIAQKIVKTEKGLIVVGPLEHYDEFRWHLIKLSELIGFPVLADGCSQIRFSKYSKKMITTYDSFLRDEQIRDDLKPEFILHFGRTSTSKILNEFTGISDCERFVINEHGDVFDPTKSAKAIIIEYPDVFISNLIEKLNKKELYRNKNDYPQKFFKLEREFILKKKSVIKNEKKINSISMIDSCVRLFQQNGNIFLSNSLPVRDFDSFSGRAKKKLNIYFNRGASGIDGIIASASGVAASRNKPTVLFIGDLAFQHDLSSLFLSNYIDSPFVIVLINNNGGGIFYNLPISKYGKLFEEYFVTPMDRDFGLLVKGYGVKHYHVNSVKAFEQRLAVCLKEKGVTVIEIKVDENESINLRKEIRAIDKIDS